MSARYQDSRPEPWAHIGTGVHLDHPQALLELGLPDSARKGYSVAVIDPKGDIGLFSKITRLAEETDRLADLMLITPIFPQYSRLRRNAKAEKI